MMTQVMPPVSILSESQSSVATPATVTSTPSTPNHTPPGTPTTPTTPFLPSPTTGGTGSTSATSQNPVSKQKNKKRKLKVNSFELFSWYTCYGFFYICHDRNSFMGPSSLPYYFYSINRLLNFWTSRVGAYSRWALIRGWELIKFSPFSAISVVFFL